jgi:hypothetical protein
LAIFTKEGGPFIYCYSVDKPPCATRSGHSVLWQITGDKSIVYMSERVNQAAYAGINAPQDGESVFDGPEDTNSCVLR